MKEDASYICDCCGKEITVPVDVSAGSLQEYIEDCPVCCHPNVVRVLVDANGDAEIHSEAE